MKRYAPSTPAEAMDIYYPDFLVSIGMPEMSDIGLRVFCETVLELENECGVRIEFNRRRSGAIAFSRSRRIEFGRNIEYTEILALHEIAHIQTNPECSHGYEFQENFVRLLRGYCPDSVFLEWMEHYACLILLHKKADKYEYYRNEKLKKLKKLS